MKKKMDYKVLFALSSSVALVLLVYYYAQYRKANWIEGIAHIETSDIKRVAIKIEQGPVYQGRTLWLDKAEYPAFLQALKRFTLLDDDAVQLLVSERYQVMLTLNDGENREFVVLRSGKFHGGVLEIVRSNIISAKAHNDDLLHYIHSFCENRGNKWRKRE